jgi:crotonobetaine/carnitine-CoA ligase
MAMEIRKEEYKMRQAIDYPGLVKSIPGWTDMNVRDYFEKKVDAFGEQTFLIFKDQEISFKETDKIVNRLANGLKSLGLKRGDVVGIYLGTCLEWVFSFLAILKIGSVVLPINIDLKKTELTGILRHSEMRAVITDPKLHKGVFEINDKLENLQQIICVGEPRPDGSVSFEGLIQKNSEELNEVEIGVDDPASIIYTFASGKVLRGVVSSHRYKTRYGALTNYSFRLTPRDRIMVVVPLFHGVGLWHGLMGAIDLGIPCILIERFSASDFWNQARKYNATVVYAVGIILGMLYNQPEKPEDPNHPIRMIWAFMMPPEIHLAFEKRFKCMVLEGLGQTETGRICLSYPPIRKIGAVGVAFDEFTDVTIRDEANNEVPLGKIGEICVRSPVLMSCLWKDPEETDKAFLGGWYHTHDLGRMDEDRFLYFEGRKIDSIRRRGKMILCSDVEEAIKSHPGIQEAMVGPVQSDLAEEEILAIMVARDAKNPADPVDVARLCKERLTYYKVPRYYMYCDKLPKDRFLMMEIIKDLDPKKCVEIPVTKEGEEVRLKEK